MKFIFVIRYLLLSLLLINTSAYSENSVAFLDLDIIIKKSVAGISITSQLNEIKKKQIENFKKKELILKDKENKLISQKNVISKDKFEKQVLNLRKEIENYKITRNKEINDSNQKMVNAQSSLLNKMTPILTNYSNEKNISIIIPKKNIIIGRTERNITKEILQILDKKIKKIKVN